MSRQMLRRFAAEMIGTALLLMAVVGSGIMAERLAGGNIALALLCNTIATGAMLFVLITMLAPISGAHFNPAVSLVFRVRGELSSSDLLAYVAVQIAGGLLGVVTAHAMFGEILVQLSSTGRSGPSQWLSEAVASFGLVLTILLTLSARPQAVAASVGLFITSAYWFTASTSFANPAVTIARAFTDTFAGVRPVDVPPFIVAEIAGALIALALANFLIDRQQAEND